MEVIEKYFCVWCVHSNIDFYTVETAVSYVHYDILALVIKELGNTFKGIKSINNHIAFDILR